MKGIAGDVFAEVFPGRFRQGLHERALSAPEDQHLSALDRYLNDQHPWLQAYRIHLAAWLDFCKAKAGLSHSRRKELRTAKTTWKWEQVLNELRVPYFLHRVFGFDIEYLPNGPDVVATFGKLHIQVEIKTPGREDPEPPEGTRWLGKDELSIEQNLGRASQQFERGNANLLVICGQCLESCPVSHVVDIEGALFGHEVVTVKISSDSGVPVEPLGTSFRPDGKLRPCRFTRVSCVMAFNDKYLLSTPKEGFCLAPHQYSCALWHNPHAEVPISCGVFPHTRQLVFDASGEGRWLWPTGDTFTFRGFPGHASPPDPKVQRRLANLQARTVGASVHRRLVR